jgi:hypothetical protein
MDYQYDKKIPPNVTSFTKTRVLNPPLPVPSPLKTTVKHDYQGGEEYEFP